MSVTVYYKIKPEWTREECAACCLKKERSGLVWCTEGIWSLRGMRKELKQEDATHIRYTVKMLGNEVEGTSAEHVMFCCR